MVVALVAFLLSFLAIIAQLYPSDVRPIYHVSYQAVAADGDSSTNQETRQQKKEMESYIERACWTAFGGGITAAFGLFAFYYQRTRSAKDLFCAEMVAIRNDAVREARELKAEAFYRASRLDVQRVVFKLLPFLYWGKPKRLISVWSDYDSLDIRRLDSDYESPLHEASHSAVGEAHNPRPSELLSEMIGKIIHTVDKGAWEKFVIGVKAHDGPRWLR